MLTFHATFWASAYFGETVHTFIQRMISIFVSFQICNDLSRCVVVNLSISNRCLKFSITVYLILKPENSNNIYVLMTRVSLSLIVVSMFDKFITLREKKTDYCSC